jgi:Arc/MetJ-type ribon-helix-helix transcriptional regulator
MARKAVEKVNITKQQSRMIDELIARGIYISRDEFVRECCRQGLIKYLELKVLIYGELA